MSVFSRRTGRHAADPLAEAFTPPGPGAPAQAQTPGWDTAPIPSAVTYGTGQGVTVDLRGIPGVPARRSIAADYRELGVFRSAVRKACAEGLRGIGVRGCTVAPVPDYRIAETCEAWPAVQIDRGYQDYADAAAERAHRGFDWAQRWFHSANTMEMRAVR